MGAKCHPIKDIYIYVPRRFIKLCYGYACVYFAVMSHEHYGFSNHQQLNCFFDRLFWLRTHHSSEILVLCEGWWLVESSHKGPVMWKCGKLFYVIMDLAHLPHNPHPPPPVRCQAIIRTNGGWLSIASLGTNLSEIQIKKETFHSWKCICKCGLRNGGHDVQGEMSWTIFSWERTLHVKLMREDITCETSFLRMSLEMGGLLETVEISRNQAIYMFRADSRFVPSQWEMALLCNDVSHWLGASLELALYVLFPAVV